MKRRTSVRVDGALGEIALLHGGEERRVVAVILRLAEVGAFVVHAALERDRRGLRLAGAVAVPVEYVAHGIAVGHDVALELPGAAQSVLQRELVGAGRLPIDAVVGAHDGSGVTLDDGGAECRKVGVFHVMLADIDVGEMTRGLRTAVHDEVLRGRDGEVVAGVRALHSRHVRYRHLRGEERVLAVGFLTAPPARVTEDIDVGCPEVEAVKDGRAAGAHRLPVHDPSLDADVVGHLMNTRGVEGRAEADRLREFSGAVHGNPVQGLAPPVVRRHAEPRNRPGPVDELRDFLLQRHAMHQVRRAHLRRQAGIEIRGGRGICGMRAAGEDRQACNQRGRRPQAGPKRHAHSPRSAGGPMIAEMVALPVGAAISSRAKRYTMTLW